MPRHATKTPLTEQQAKALAYWWGGDYEQIQQPGAAVATRHEVVLSLPPGGAASASQTPPIRVGSLEDAWAIENRRGFQEACSPDWIG